MAIKKNGKLSDIKLGTLKFIMGGWVVIFKYLNDFKREKTGDRRIIPGTEQYKTKIFDVHPDSIKEDMESGIQVNFQVTEDLKAILITSSKSSNDIY
jgi:hypothetical protein